MEMITKQSVFYWLGTTAFIFLFTLSYYSPLHEIALVLFCFSAIAPPYYFWVRWIADTAQKAGRSKNAFLVVGIFFPLIATFIVMTFKPQESNPDTNNRE